MTNKKTNEPENLNYLLDPLISVEEINNIIYEGDLIKLYKLSQNVKFKDIDSEVFISMAKVKIPFYQNNDYQSLFIIALLILNILWNGLKVSFQDPTNLSLLFVLGYLFWKSKSYKKKIVILEKERILHIQKILKDSDFSIDNLIDKSIWNDEDTV